MTERFDSFDEEHRALEEKQIILLKKLKNSLKKKTLLKNDFQSLEKISKSE